MTDPTKSPQDRNRSSSNFSGNCRLITHVGVCLHVRLMFKDVAEVVFAHSLFQTLRSNHVSLDVIAEHVSRQDGQTGDGNRCSGVLATKVAEHFQSLQPQRNQESDRVAALQSHIQELQKQVAAQQRATQTAQAPSTAPLQRVADQSGAPLDLDPPDKNDPWVINHK